VSEALPRFRRIRHSKHREGNSCATWTTAGGGRLAVELILLLTLRLASAAKQYRLLPNPWPVTPEVAGLSPVAQAGKSRRKINELDFMSGKLRAFPYTALLHFMVPWLVIRDDTEHVGSRDDPPIPTHRHVAGFARRRGSRKPGKYKSLRSLGMHSSTLPGGCRPDFGRRAVAQTQAILALLCARRPVSPLVNHWAGKPIIWLDKSDSGVFSRSAHRSITRWFLESGWHRNPTLPSEPSMTHRETAPFRQEIGAASTSPHFTLISAAEIWGITRVRL
jgi:hypothetical protein